MDNFTIIKKLGEGAFGIVYKVRRKTDKRSYALKKIHLRNMNKRQIEDGLNEVRLLASLKHKHIIKFYEAFPSGNYKYNFKLCIVMECARGGDLAMEIKKYKRLRMSIPEHRIWNYIRQISDALKFLHENGILHRDIKAANCFLTSHGVIKIGDMSISKIVKHGELARTRIGTPYYMSPEIWSYRAYGPKSDVWSCGCLFYELAALTVPFTGYNTFELARKIKTGKYIKFPNRIYKAQLWNFIQSMLYVRPSLRPSMRHIHTISSKYVRSTSPVNIPEEANLLRTIKMTPRVEQLTNVMPVTRYHRIKRKRSGLDIINESNIRLPRIS
jgi:NIMA (never in mitosis gene a)-related kinase 1/4/5